MNLALIFLIVAALFGYTAEKNLDDNPNLGIPATAISLICTVAGLMIIFLERNNW
jgi:hypothetical protein